ncbi:hypothetical protein OS493_020793 [Desmophyllum pertusum]|uniref:Uncharacterized protein n=1 Tax=Desmophyllum pertusum TaxID=174260 RepID=A0A9X0CM40_9CNID|nr:hypothetical protein OS493_020793 [Desmophyllum pertusum]
MAARFTPFEQLQSELKNSQQLCKSLENIRKTQAEEINAMMITKQWANDDCMLKLLENECHSMDDLCAQKDMELKSLREQVRILQASGKSRNNDDCFWRWYNKAKYDVSKHTDAAYYLPSKYWEQSYTIHRLNKECDELKEKIKHQELKSDVEYIEADDAYVSDVSST